MDLEDILAERVTQNGRGPVDAASIALWCSAVEDANPWHWASGERLVAPPAMVGTWTQKPPWTPAGLPERSMELHHRFKERMQLPFAVVREVSHEYGVPVRLGDRLTATHRIVDVGPLRHSRMGEGRDWSVQVSHWNQRDEPVALETWRFHGFRRADTAPSFSNLDHPASAEDPVLLGSRISDLTIDIDASRIIKSAAASGDWTGFHHDRVSALSAGMPDIILNTAGHLALASRWITDNVEVNARLQRLSLRLRHSLTPGHLLRLRGRVLSRIDVGGGFSRVELAFVELVGDRKIASGSATAITASSGGSGIPWEVPIERWESFGGPGQQMGAE